MYDASRYYTGSAGNHNVLQLQPGDQTGFPVVSKVALGPMFSTESLPYFPFLDSGVW